MPLTHSQPGIVPAPGSQGFAMVNVPSPIPNACSERRIDGYFGQPFIGRAESANKSYNIAKEVYGACNQFLPSEVPISLDRFQTKLGDIDNYTTGSHQRSEYDAGDAFRDSNIIVMGPGATCFPLGTTLWISYSLCFVVDPISGLIGYSDTDFNIIGQMHASAHTGSSDFNPPFSCNYNGNAGVLSATGFSSIANPMTGPGTQVFYNNINSPGTTIANHWYHFVHNFKFDPGGGTGFAKTWLDGTLASNYTVNLGYTIDDGSYWKFGVYQDSGNVYNNNTLIVWYSNMEVGTNDLTARIANPLATPS